MPQWLVIGISGVTCGGKTTLSHNLRDYFLSKQNTQLCRQMPYTIGDVQLISQDDYFLPADDLRHKWIDKLNAINFELLTSLDMKQMLSDITWTMKGRYLANNPIENIDYISEMSMPANFEQYAAASLMPPPPPVYNYHSNKLQQQQLQQLQQHQPHYHAANPHHYHHHQQQQQPQQQPHPQQQQQQQQQQQPQQHRPHQQRQNHQQRHSMRVKVRDCKLNILILEGFMIFNQPELLTLCNLKFHFHLPYEKCFERRRKRTYDPPDVTGYFEMCVWPHYEKNFLEFRDRKDITFLNGEISKERICNFVLQKIMNYMEERCDVAMLTTTTIPANSSSFTTQPPQKVMGIHNGNGNTPRVCPMEQQ